MQFSLLVLSSAVLISSALGGFVDNRPSHITELALKALTKDKLGLDLCPGCCEFAQQFLQGLIELILRVETDSCGDLCQAAFPNSAAVSAVCDILCDVVGIKEFVNIIQKADLDPIYYCELLTVCPINDHGDAKFTSFDIAPPKGHKGDTFSLSFQYTSQNGTGTGMIFLAIDAPDGHGPAQGFVNQMAPAGTYDGTIQLKADSSCSPDQDPNCESWGHGNYSVTISICNGECGSKHPHSAIYDTTTAEFRIVKDDD